MASLGEWLSGLFAFLGPTGTLLALFLVFVVDAALFPTLPELFFVLSFTFRIASWDPASWALLLLAMAVAGEATGNTIMYLWVRKLIVDRGHMPERLARIMKGWTQFLVVRDERIILINRIAPVLPLVGAFIATLGWSYPRSMGYIVTGALAKYTVLLALVAWLGVAYNRDAATLITVVAILAVVAASLLLSVVYRRRALGPSRGAS